MGKAPAFQLFAADFYMDTLEWSVDEVGMYWRLLEAQWVNGSLPNNEVRLARIAGCGTKKFQKGWTTIQFKFVLNGNGRLQNIRLEETREEQRKYRESQAEKSKKGVEARQKQLTQGSTHGLSNGSTPGQPLQSSSSKEDKEKKIYKRKVPLPKDYKLTDEHIEYATSKGVSRSIIEDGFEAFCIHHTKQGSKFIDWFAAWQTWIRKRIEFNKGSPIQPGIEYDNTAVEEMNQELEKITPELRAKNKAMIAKLAGGVTKNIGG